jgi:putative nucleotidyltransferase with HDIG domain
MSLPITREEALEFLKSMPQETSDMNHYLESEAIMRGLARRFGEDEEYWGMLGLLHDVDWSKTKGDLERHCLKCEDILKGLGFDDEFVRIVQSHAYGLDIIPTLKDKERTSKVEYSLVAAETLTGLIYAYALMRGGITGMKVKGLKKKFKDKIFAAGCNRDLIREIEKTGLELSEFFEIGIESVRGIKDDVGLE